MSKELLDAINAQNWKVAGDLIEAGADLTTVDEKGNTALHLAVTHRHTPTVRSLLDKGANINAINKIGETPLHCIDKGPFDKAEASVIFELLVTQGANLTLRDHQGLLPWACITDHGVYEYNEEDDKFIEALTLLFNKEVNTNAVLSNGETLLHHAAQMNRAEVVKFLLGRDADVHAKTKGKTALLLAAESASPSIFPLLINAGANIHAKNWDNKTVLHCVLENGIEDEECILDCLQILLDSGAITDINEVDQNGNTPLHLAAMRFSQGNEDEVKPLWDLLISNGANFDAVNKRGQTPLYIFNERLGYVPHMVAAAAAEGIPPAAEVWEAQASDFPLNQDAAENRQLTGARPAKKARVQERPDHLKFGAYTEADIELITDYYEKLQQAPKTPHTEFVLASMESTRCRCTLDFPKYPVLLLADGYTYEWKAVNQWVSKNLRSPSNQEIHCTPHDIVDNRTARELMDSFIRMAQADKLTEDPAMEVKGAAEANQSSGLLFSPSLLPSYSSSARSSSSASSSSSSSAFPASFNSALASPSCSYGTLASSLASSSSAFAVNSVSAVASNSMAGHLAEPMEELDEDSAAAPAASSNKRRRSE